MKKMPLYRIFIIILAAILFFIAFYFKKSIHSSILFYLGVVAALFILNINAEKITHLSNDNPKLKTFKKLNILTILIFTLVAIGVEFGYLDPDAPSQSFIILISVFIIYFGNLAPTIPFNRHIGLRLPWTTSDEYTWRIAHKTIGYISFPIGILMIIASFFIETEKVMYLIILWIIIPSIYSLLVYIKNYNKIV